MALQSMGYTTTNVGNDVVILKRLPFEAVAITLDTTAFTSGVCKAGTPISAAGVIANTAAAKGILLHDVYQEHPQAQVLTKAYIDKAKAQAHSGVTLDATAIAVLPMIVLE